MSGRSSHIVANILQTFKSSGTLGNEWFGNRLLETFSLAKYHDSSLLKDVTGLEVLYVSYAETSFREEKKVYNSNHDFLFLLNGVCMYFQ